MLRFGSELPGSVVSKREVASTSFWGGDRISSLCRGGVDFSRFDVSHYITGSSEVVEGHKQGAMLWVWGMRGEDEGGSNKDWGCWE